MSNFIGVSVPRFMASGTSTRLPVVYRATVQGLIPFKTYRYFNMGAVNNDLGTTAPGAGNPLLINSITSVFTYTSAGSLTTSGNYETFIADATGNYTGWFAFIHTGNARFTPGNNVIPSLVLGDTTGTLLARYALNDSITVLAFSSSPGVNYGTGVYGISLGLPKNFVALYDNTSGTGKPLAQTYTESEGILIPNVVQFYADSVNGINGRWGTILPNTLPGGLMRVELRSITNGSLISYNTSSTGIWQSGINTINPSGGASPLRLAPGDAPLFNAPLLVTPANGTVDLTITPILTWSGVPTATSYRVQVSQDSLFSIPSFDTVLSAITVMIPSGKITTNTKYFWRANATNSVGTGAWSTIWNFTTAPLIPNAPVLAQPINGAVNQPTSVTFIWYKSLEQLVTKANNKTKVRVFKDGSLTISKYWIEYSTDSTFTNSVTRDTTLTDTTKSVTGLNNLATYYWRVRSLNQTGWGNFSAVWKFTTIIATPAAPTLITPVNNATCIALTPTMTWGAVAGALSYRLQISTDSTFGTTTWDTSGVAGTSATVQTGKLNNFTKYYWRVNATNSGGTGAWSLIWNFTTMLGTPTLISPPNNATNVSLTPTLTWSSVTGATSYRVQISTDSTFSTTVWDSSGITGTSVNVLLSQTTAYFWRVNASNSGCTGHWSSTFRFTTLSLGLPLNLKVYMEGFWGGTSQVVDTMRIYLANSTAPYAYVDSNKLILSATGTTSPLFTHANAGNYFIVVKHRNHLETWSRLPQTFAPGVPVNYDFTTDSAKAYGFNMKKVGNVWVTYGGDPNQDGSIDALDIPIFIAQYGQTGGYFSCDFNGDGSVDALDVQIIVANFGLTKSVPTLIAGFYNNINKKKQELMNMIKSGKMNTPKDSKKK